MVEIIKISKEGKIILPREVRKEIGLTGDERYVLVTDQGDIILKRVNKDRERIQRDIQDLLEEFHVAFKKAKVKPKDVEAAIREVRNRK
jgi:bifunctional DNA-binding transcriptional regulator/antitoxin component of YhaV-PrlF toxin-antitoxin module